MELKLIMQLTDGDITKNEAGFFATRRFLRQCHEVPRFIFLRIWTSGRFRVITARTPISSLTH
jgi:hypothetical protein